jgi:hypothetical protein
VQVGVPQGSAADQQRVQTRQQQQAAERAKLAALPIPRFSDGHIVIGATKEMKGVWLPGPANFGITAPPYQEWTRNVAQYRRRMQLEPHTRCKPSGGPRQFLTPTASRSSSCRERSASTSSTSADRIRIARSTWTGGRIPDKLQPTFYGDSIGWWEGDTLVIDSVGFNEDMWIDRGNLAAHLAAPPDREVDTFAVRLAEVRDHRRRPRRLHADLQRQRRPALGAREQNCSNTCASRKTTPTS